MSCQFFRRSLPMRRLAQRAVRSAAQARVAARRFAACSRVRPARADDPLRPFRAPQAAAGAPAPPAVTASRLPELLPLRAARAHGVRAAHGAAMTQPSEEASVPPRAPVRTRNVAPLRHATHIYHASPPPRADATRR